MRIVLETKRCIGAAACVKAADDVFTLNEKEGLVKLSSADRAGGLSVHPVPIYGMTLRETFHSDALAADCAAVGVREFLFLAPPFKVVGAVGTPVTLLAIS